MLFDIVIPTLDATKAASVVDNLKEKAEYAHNYVIIDNGDSPQGYTAPCNLGAKAGNCAIVCFVNDDISIKSHGWDEVLLEEAQRHTYCFGPWTPREDTMRLNGWFLCLRRDYINVYGWAFDPRFVVWCGDIDLLMRLEEDNIEPVLVKDIEIEHSYSETTSRPDLQSWIVGQQMQDLVTFENKWGVDANEVKVKSGTSS